MITEYWPSPSEQYCTIGKQKWSVVRLIELSKSLPVYEVDIHAIYMDMALTSDWRLKDMATHFKAVMKADLSFPIILDQDGSLMDGRHRIVKALVEGAKTIKFVRFEKNPPADITEND